MASPTGYSPSITDQVESLPPREDVLNDNRPDGPRRVPSAVEAGYGLPISAKVSFLANHIRLRSVISACEFNDSDSDAPYSHYNLTTDVPSLTRTNQQYGSLTDDHSASLPNLPFRSPRLVQSQRNPPLQPSNAWPSLILSDGHRTWRFSRMTYQQFTIELSRRGVQYRPVSPHAGVSKSRGRHNAKQSGSSSSAKKGENYNGKGKNRRRQKDQIGDDNDSDENEDGSLAPKNFTGEPEEIDAFACPFAVRDPSKYEPVPGAKFSLCIQPIIMRRMK
jgi:hypothetical protein